MRKETSNTQAERRSGASRPVRRPSFLVRSLLLLLRAYKILISPLLTVLCGPVGGCRFTPTCSVYAMDALREHGTGAGAWLAAKRICRCQPWGGCGHDPVPPRRNTGNADAGMQELTVSRSASPAPAAGTKTLFAVHS